MSGTAKMAQVVEAISDELASRQQYIFCPGSAPAVNVIVA
jgi:hypothetical protein